MKPNENYRVINPAKDNEPATIEIIPTNAHGNSDGIIYKDEPIPKRRKN